MLSVLKMILKNIKKKKVQSIVLFITIVVSALMLSTAIGIMSTASEPVDKMFKELNASNVVFTVDERAFNVSEISNWWEKQKGIEGVQSFPFYYYKGNLTNNGVKLNSELFITERPSVEIKQDKLIIVEGDKKTAPSKGEAWVSTGFASSKEIKISDDIAVTTKNGLEHFKVSAIVVDPQFSGKIQMSPARLWVSENTIRNIFNDKNYFHTLIGLRYSELSFEKDNWNSFLKSLKEPYTGYKIDYSMFKTMYALMNQVIGILMILFSVIILFVVVIVLFLTISGSVYADYKVIGILKSQGFSPRNIILTYCGQYFILALVALPVGVTISYFIIKSISMEFMKSLGMTDLGISMVAPVIVTVLTLLGVVGLSSFFASLKAGKIKPTQAIRMGAPQRKQKNISITNRVPIIKSSPSLIMGMKSIISYKRRSVFLILIVTFSVFASVFSLNIYNTMGKIDENPEVWGFPNCNVVVTLQANSKVSSNELLNAFKGDKRVKDVTLADVIPVSALRESKEEMPMNILGQAIEGNMENIGYANLEGKNPVGDSQISLSYNAAKSLNKKVGDYIELLYGGKSTNLLVTGIFQSMNNMGVSYRVPVEVMRKIQKDYQLSYFNVNLNHNKDTKAFVDEYTKLYGSGAEITSEEDIIKKQIDSIANTMAIPLAMIAAMFLVVAFIIIFNSTLMSINEQRKNFGIFKTMGMTPKQIRLTVVSSYMLLTLLSVTVGMFLGLYLSPKILSVILSSVGVMDIKLDIAFVGTVLIIPITFLVIGASTWLPTRILQRISPRDLIVE